MHLLEITFQAFFDDTKALVSDGVRKDVSSSISNSSSPSQQKEASQFGKKRLASLKSWLASERPLAYGHDNSQPTYNLLLQAVSPSPHDLILGLPNFQAHAMTPSRFADLLIKMSSPSTRSRPSAPVLSNGSFLPLLKLTHKHLITLSDQTQIDAQNSFIHSFLIRAIDHLQIRFIPSHKPLPSTTRSGAPDRIPLYNSWAHLGLRDPNSIQSSFIQPSSSQSSPPHPATTLALNNALATDCNSEWFLRSTSLINLHTCLHKTSLPRDFPTPSLTGTHYVDDTYQWVRQSYNGTNPLHHFALLLAIIASYLTPNLFFPKDPNHRSLFSSANSSEQVRTLYNDIPWIFKKTNGMKDKPIFVAMFTTYIIALYEPQSPLRLYLSTSQKGGLGEPWTSKHCMSFLFLPPFSLQLSPF
jgi:hypothetical protein